MGLIDNATQIQKGNTIFTTEEISPDIIGEIKTVLHSSVCLLSKLRTNGMDIQMVKDVIDGTNRGAGKVVFQDSEILIIKWQEDGLHCYIKSDSGYHIENARIIGNVSYVSELVASAIKGVCTLNSDTLKLDGVSYVRTLAATGVSYAYIIGQHYDMDADRFGATLHVESTDDIKSNIPFAVASTQLGLCAMLGSLDNIYLQDVQVLVEDSAVDMEDNWRTLPKLNFRGNSKFFFVPHEALREGCSK